MKKLKRIFGSITIVFFSLIMLINVYYIASRLIFKQSFPSIFGYSFTVVISGSMQPDINVGDLLIIQRQKPGEYKVGDVVTFSEKSHFVTHQIIERQGDAITTKGTSNNVADPPITPNQIFGKTVAIVPGAGGAIQFLTSTPGIVILIFVGFLIFWLPGAIRSKRVEEK